MARGKRWAARFSPVVGNGPHDVTGLTRDTRVPGYLVVEVDGARFTSLPESQIARLGVAVGQRFEGQRLADLQSVAETEAAYRVALRLLEVRPRAVNELLRRLRDRGHPPPAADGAVGRLQSEGLLDDDQFARHFARVRAPKGHGARRLITDLMARGVDKRVAESAVYDTLESEEVDPQAQVRALTEKRIRQMRDLPLEKQRRRVLAYLNRRGFSGYDVTAVVDELLATYL